jgi:hypothetical protein
LVTPRPGTNALQCARVLKRAWIISLLLAIASATGARAADGAFDVRLIEPAEHVDLVAGSTVSIAWEARNQPAAVEEWEAFLSINGGRTYPIRLTPHLDVTIQRFTWTVPSLPGAEASLLLRFGDEQRERRFVFPARMRIKGAMPFDLLRFEASAEAALLGGQEEDDHGEKLVEWVEGSRDGSRLRLIFGGGPLLAGEQNFAAPRDEESVPAAGSASTRLDPATLPSLENDRVLRRGRPPNVRYSQRRQAGVLLLSRRLNI